jgi:predicted acylesterase/phospholipase RssA
LRVLSKGFLSPKYLYIERLRRGVGSCELSCHTKMSFIRNVHFGGGAWATSFHIGVVKALEELWNEAKKQSDGSLSGKLCDNMEVSGDSAGAAIGAGMQLG